MEEKLLFSWKSRARFNLTYQCISRALWQCWQAPGRLVAPQLRQVHVRLLPVGSNTSSELFPMLSLWVRLVREC